MNFSSKLLEDAVHEFSKLPGVGQKTALRLVLHLLNRDLEEVSHFGNTLIKLKEQIKHCSICHNISDHSTCSICAATKRDKELICIVEDTRDVMAIENTNQFQGLYHVLGGLISPMDGIGPQDLNILSLPARIEKDQPKEIILALSPTMEGDTTNFYIYKKIKVFDVLITRISRGIAVGSELQYADELTLGRSLQQRQVFQSGH